MECLQERMNKATKNHETLEEILQIKYPTSVERDASIQRFKNSFEAMWKFAKQYLRDIEGIDIGSPKGVIRSCREIGIFNEKETITALEMVDDRNLTVHTYNEELAEEIYRKLETYRVLMKKWIKRLSERILKKGRQNND